MHCRNIILKRFFDFCRERKSSRYVFVNVFVFVCVCVYVSGKLITDPFWFYSSSLIITHGTFIKQCCYYCCNSCVFTLFVYSIYLYKFIYRIFNLYILCRSSRIVSFQSVIKFNSLIFAFVVICLFVHASKKKLQCDVCPANIF